jgi:hypothetical protein
VTSPADNAHVCDAAQDPARCPMPDRGATLRERALAIARGELSVREDDGPNRDKAGRIAGYLSGCVRGGKRLGLGPSPWCAAFVSWCVWSAFPGFADGLLGYQAMWTPRSVDVPFGYRASVAELCADARATGALRLPSAHLLPDVADVAIFARDGGNPLHGGVGHCGFVVAIGGDWIDVLAGNQSDAVTIERRTFGDLLTWIALGP